MRQARRHSDVSKNFKRALSVAYTEDKNFSFLIALENSRLEKMRKKKNWKWVVVMLSFALLNFSHYHHALKSFGSDRVS